MKTSSFVSASLLGLTVAAAAFAAPSAPNAVQTKYIKREGTNGGMCSPQGQLKELTNGKYKCYAPGGAEKCQASIDAANGVLDAKFVEMFGELLKTDGSLKNGYLYRAGCQDLAGADFVEVLAIGGLSYAKKSPEVLLGLGTAENFGVMGGANRADYIAALGRYGEPQKAQILPILKLALTVKGSLLDFKKNTLKLMARFGSDDGVAYCLDVLKTGADKDVTRTCAWYLGERKATTTSANLLTRLEDEKVWFTRALGLIGSKEAVDNLKADYEKNAGSVTALASTVALLNLGDKSYDYAGDLLSMVAGKRPLSIKDRAKKAEELKAKKKGAAERWQKREDEVQEDVARAAAIESTYVLDATIGKKVDEALKVTAKKTEWVKASAHALSALGQRGDKTAIPELIKLLTSSKEEAREIAINAFGARYDAAEAFPEYVGRKGIVVVDATVPPALAKYIENEPKEERRMKGLLALGATRSFLP